MPAFTPVTPAPEAPMPYSDMARFEIVLMNGRRILL
jgi:hypothetical protein